MRKFINLVALAALLFVPWVVDAQSGCTIRVAGTDGYGDGWNGGSLTIAQSGATIGTFTLNSGASGESTFVLPTDDPVTFTWSSGSWDSEVTINIYDGGNTLVYSVSEPSAGLIYTMSSPCPSCLPPTDLVATDISTDGMTVSWTDASNSGNYIFSYWGNGDDTTSVTLTDNSYTLTGLEANRLYYFSVVSVCSATDESSPLTGSFATLCAGSTCDMTLELGSTYSYVNPFTYYSGPATVELLQNGISYGAYSSNTSVTVCSTDPVVVKYHHSGYTWDDYYDNYATITVRDGGGVAVYSGGWGDTLCVVGSPCPTCIPPTALTALADSASIEFSWTPRSDATQFIVFLGDSVVDDNVTDTFYTFTGLSANTQYTVKVQSVCSDDDSSSIVSTGVRTECGSISVPFYEDFNSYGYGTFPPCWHRVMQHGSDPSVNTEISGLNGSMYMFCIASNDTNLFVSPSAVPLPGNMIHVSYDAFLSGSNGWIKAGVMTNYNDVSTFVALDSVGMHSFNNNFESRDFSTSTLNANENYYIAWMYFSTSSSSRGAVDNIIISEATGCERPSTAYNPANITAHTVDLAWSEVEGAAGYTVYYGTVNDVTNTANVQSTTTSDTAITLTGLSGETHYYVWVATNCSGIESDVRSFSSFTTLISCPAVVNLTVDTTAEDGATISWNTQGTETEWAVVVDSNDVEIVYDSTYTITGLEPMTGHIVYVRPVCGADDTGAVRSVNFATTCVAPTCNVTVEMSDSYGDGWNGGAVNIYQAGIQVGSTTLSGGSTGSGTVEVCSSASFEIRVTSGSYPSEMSFVVHDGGGSIVYTATQGSISSSSNGTVLATVDTPCPDCIMPGNLVVDTVTADEVTISWIAQEGQTEWAVRLDTNEVFVVTGTSYTFANLESRTAYTAYVATICDGDTTQWASIQFTTDCANGSCDITVNSTADYVYSYYCPTLHVWQNGEEVASVNANTQNVNVCSGMPVYVILEAAGYDWDNPAAIILDGVGDEYFNGSTSGLSTGDTLAVMENACPTCLRPAGLMVSELDSNHLEFSWVDTVAYEVSFNGSDWQPASSPYNTMYNLLPNTEYTFSVRTVCSDEDVSSASTITVRTSCGEVAVPYSEGFEGQSQGEMPSCWTLVAGAGYDGYPGVSTSGHTGSRAITLAANYGDSATVATSLVGLPGDEIHVSFWASINPGNTLLAGVMTDLAYDTTFIPVLTLPDNNATYTRYEFSTSALSSTDQYYVAFRLVCGNNNHYVDLDDVEITQEQGCSYPSNLTATPGAHNIDLTWVNNATVSDFVVIYRTGNNAWDTAGITVDTNYSITGLNAAMMYQVGVGLICNNDTLWTYTSMATTCDLMAVPYFEDFSTTAQGSMPPCWTYDSGVDKYDGGAMWHTWTGDGNTIAVVPALNGNVTKLQITFKAKLGTIAEDDGVMIGVADAQGNLLAWLDTLQDPEQSREAFVWFTVYFPEYVMPGGAARVAFGHTLNTGNWFLIDDISIIELPDCYPVSNLTGNNLIDPEATTFTWHPQGNATQWQVYVDTVTVGLDSVENMPESNFITVSDTSYTIPIGTIQGGGIYNFFVRSSCDVSSSDWVMREFGAGTVKMNQSTVADTVVGCGFVVYDNGGPIAGYVPISSSALVLRSVNVGSQLQIFGGKFGFGSSPATLTVYDGEGTSGNVLYTYNTVDGRDTLMDTVLAVTTTGAMTITFSVSGNMCHTGYELYIRCTEGAICPRPTELQANMTDYGVANVTWTGDAPNYSFYHRIAGSDTWDYQNVTTNSLTLTGLTEDTTYEMYVVALCTATDSSTASVVRQLNTHYEMSCDAPTNLSYSNVTQNSAVISWTAGGTETAWNLECNGTLIPNVTNPYTLTGLTAATQYVVKVQAVCSATTTSGWSAPIVFITEQGSSTQYYDVIVIVNDTTMGSVDGAGTYAEGTNVTLTANANNGYHFVNWSTGEVTASINITVNSNITLTATFAENDPETNYYTVTVRSDNPNMGEVTGSGTYEEGTEITIKAIPYDGYVFIRWQDNVTDSVRHFTVDGDVTFIAYFGERQGIDNVDDNTHVTLFPNPASTMVTVDLVGIEGTADVCIIDQSGRTVYNGKTDNSRLQINVSDFAKGAYFVRITGSNTSAVRKLVVK